MTKLFAKDPNITILVHMNMHHFDALSNSFVHRLEILNNKQQPCHQPQEASEEAPQQKPHHHSPPPTHPEMQLHHHQPTMGIINPPPPPHPPPPPKILPTHSYLPPSPSRNPIQINYVIQSPMQLSMLVLPSIHPHVSLAKLSVKRELSLSLGRSPPRHPSITNK